MPAELLPHPAAAPSDSAAARLATPRRRASSRPGSATGWLTALLLVLLVGLGTTARAQTAAPPPECAADEKFANTWYFGFKAGLDFNSATDSIPPKVLTDGAMVAPAGSGVMSDKNGKILFYSNGRTVWNGDGTVMTNGQGLAGDSLTTDGPLPIKMPGIPAAGQPTRYLLFTLNSTVGLSYSEIDIPAAGGPGTVVAATKNTPLARGTAEKLTGVFHKNGCDIWVIAHGWGDAKSGNNNRGDAFLAYRVRLATGYVGPVNIDAPILSAVGSLHAASKSPVGYKGQMRVTPDGQRLALARYSEVLGDSSSTVELFGFDTSTGQVSVNPQVPYIVDKGKGKYYGVSFSSGNYLYATVRNPPQLLQFDISGNGPVTTQTIPLKQKTPVDLGSMQAAPDGKIYVARDNQPALGFIAYPDSLGAKARYADDSLQLSGRLSGLGLVNFNQSSLLRVGPSARITGCRQISFTAPPIDFDGKTYAWSFGDGATSSLENPVHVYATPGNYVVTLRITTACFCRQSSGSIQVPDLPVPGSIAAPQTLCAGTAPALLTSTASGSSDAGLPLVYQWESSTDNVTFSAVAGATSASYQPGNLAAGTTYFRRRVQLLLPDGSGPYCTPSFTSSVAITVLPALVAGSIGADQTLCAGSPAAALTSTAPASGGAGTFTYQWEASTDNVTFTAISGATGETLAPGALAATTYFRRRVISGACTGLSANVVTITVVPALAGGAIAASQAICAGSVPSPLTSTTGATGGGGAVAYQWESSPDNTTFTAIGGAIGETYAPGALTATTYYRRRASAGSACAPAYSNVLTITVAPAVAAGTIAADQTLCFGVTPAPLTSTAAASGGSGAVAYQWQSSTDNSTFTDIAGATGATYAPGGLTATTYFRRQATVGSCAPVTSPVVTLTVLPVLTPGSIAADQTVCAGSVPAPLTSTAGASGGTGTFAYQWESSTDNSTFTAIGGATNATYTPGALTITTYFRRQVTAGSCTAAPSNVVTIAVAPALLAGTIGSNQTLCAGSAAAALTSTAPASGGLGGITYQWESSPDNTTFTAIGGANGLTYAPGALNATTYFRRQAAAGSGCAPVYSNVVTITVTPAVAAGTIGADQTLCPGAAPATLTSTVAASGGTGSFAYQWQASTDNTTFTNIAGATSETYTPGVLTVTTYFRRQVTSGSCGPVTSPSVTLTVLPALVAGTIAADQTVCSGTVPAALTSTAGASGGTGSFVYQWQSSTDNSTFTDIGGATGATYAPGALTVTTYFRRQVTAGTGACATAVSNVVTIQVQPLVTPTVTLAAPPVQCAGTPLTFTAVVTNAGAAPTFQWFVNNAAVATGPTFTSSTLATGDVVRVEVTPTVGLCSTGPATASVTVTRTATPAPTLAIAGPAAPLCPGELLTFSISSVTNAGAAPTYQWQVNGADVPGATTPIFTSTTLRDGQTVTLRLRTTDACGQAVTAVSNGVVVRILPPVVVNAGPDKEILEGSSVVLEGTADGNYPVIWTPALGLTIPANSPLRPIAAPLVTTTYTLSAGSGGCASSDQVTVTVRPAIRIPNAISPNGDGVDDTWQIDNIELYPENTVNIFNRWGDKIFSAENYSRANEWRGDIKGQPAPVGTYYYVVVTKGPLGRSYAGPITVVY